MKAIKCPNCGETMRPIEQDNIGCESYAWMGCWGCGIRGPGGNAPTTKGAVRKAARLMREWIERMDETTSDAVRRAHQDGLMKAAKYIESPRIRRSIIAEARGIGGDL